MLRAAAYSSHIASRRTFVSTVLLTRNWENESMNVLRKEAKTRGLSQSGNKATLITRLQKYEQKQQYEAPAPVVPPQQQQVRHASTTELPGVPSTSRPSPMPSHYPKEFLNVKIPSAFHPVPERAAQVPFVPDLWDSSRIKAESAPAGTPEPSNPKVLAVGGAVTHLGGGPSHALYPSSSASFNRPPNPNQGFWRDVADDLLIPTSLKLSTNDVPQVLLEGVPETTEISGRKSDIHYSRTLDQDERRGLWALLGLLAGSWVVAGIFQAPSAFAPTSEPAVAEETPSKH